MTTTTRAAVAAHTLVRRVGARPGSFHAAVPEDGAWRTACGERLQDGARGTISAWTGQEAHALLLTPQAPVCRRCDRVGESVTA
jgi:hypothetical protein